ncbi:hypothetical protein Tco_1019589 [Tanacetum coccineum]|uniref:DUF4218 domain-containing protein n=1 Tax=Tanacetum coccineum TaxID=301880 RepID=A0ABQ5FXS2_9ASTR
MIQHLLPYGLQQYLTPDVVKPLIELCLFFKQICSQTLMVDDMLKAQSKVIDILCNLELIYPPAFFDIMIHLVIHLPLEAIFGGPIRPRWMYPFERYMKKLKNYVRNKAKPEGSIAEGYVAEEALTFSSHYFRDVTTKFNRPDRNVDCPPPTCQFQVFKSLSKLIGLQSVIRIDNQELKKVICEFPDNDMKEAFPGWFGKQIRQRHVDNDPGVSESSELFALACGPSQTPISVNSCVVNGVRFVMHSRDERRTTQNSGICSPGLVGEMYYGQIEQILKFSYLLFKIMLFQVKWFDTSNKGRIKNLVIRNNITQIKANGEAFKNDQYILATQVKQCFYLEDMARRPLGWKVIEHVSHKKFSNGGVSVVEDDPDVIHVDNSSDLALSTSLNDLEIVALHIDVYAPPDIIDVVDEDDDIIDEEDLIPHDLADSDDEDLVNLDIDDGVNMSANVARGHGGDGGGDDRPPPHHIPTGYGTQFDMRPHMESDRWPLIYAAIQQHLQKIYNGKKAALKERHWIPDSDGTYDLERIRLSRPSHISEVNWDAQIGFWNDPKNRARAAQNKQNRAKSKVDEMLRLQGLGFETSMGVPYTEDKIMAIVHEGKAAGAHSRSGVADEPGDDEDGGEDEDDEEDS